MLTNADARAQFTNDSRMRPEVMAGLGCACVIMVYNAMLGAAATANERFGATGVHAQQGSVADMMTHCMGACDVARRERVCLAIGFDPRDYLQNRENAGGAENRMDYRNNLVGFHIADRGKDCFRGCKEALDKGFLWTFQGLRVMPYRRPSLQFVPQKGQAVP